MGRINVMHLTDTLDAGGAERMAVNIVNLLPRELYAVHLCTTRRDGLLDSLVTKDVRRLSLDRTWRFDLRALRRLIDYIRENNIKILHAHGTSLFAAALASALPPHPPVVWHDHYGRYRFDDRPVWLYRLGVRRIGAVIAVNQQLVEWARKRLRFPKQRVYFIPNFVCDIDSDLPAPELPGETRIACVANFRPEKDHLTLVRAMAQVIGAEPSAHLLLIGGTGDEHYLRLVRKEITSLGLDPHISVLGQRSDVPQILRACSVGVLSSASEGLPLALLEYGMARLPAVATDVGQCCEVLNGGRAGLLVSPGNPDELASALIALIRSWTRREDLAEVFHRRVRQVYSPEAVVDQVTRVYREIASIPTRWAIN